ncbi:beta-1,4-glucuronyltransferase 1-like [Neocloeon triangulifer]|uniref:beta-1,4-glucuronyltransferase 1-like n=1 Tax=Neocloeon triangulifer TaxID=2078957 RepID=UPI00286F3EFB|nr:beta-1,4-glucuronyltransferase 1-like [Neocloeon triangulifer]
MQIASSWGRTILFLIAIIAGLQVLHLILLNRLEGRQMKQQQEPSFSNVESNPVPIYLVGRHEQEEHPAPVTSIESHFSELLRMLQRGGVLDTSGQYRVVPSLAVANSHTSIFPLPDISLVTQCSSHHLRETIKLASRWQGPISVAIFSEIHDLGSTLWDIARLRFCHSSVRQNVSFQLVSPLGAAIHRTPILPTDAVGHCNFENGPSGRKNYARTQVPYPVNLLRNVARKAAQTEFVFVVDVDMLPSARLREMFLAFASRAKLFKESQQDDKTVYVVPTFELRSGSDVPESKQQLLTLAEEGSVRPFYFELCWKCQMHTDYEAWQKEPPKQNLVPIFEVLWKDPWEPFYISRNSAPFYDERFKQYGFNRISQVCELHVAGFKYSILDNAFLVHDGFKTATSFHEQKDADQETNRNLFRQFKTELKDRYPESSRRCY